jgi:hypothetical protein
MPILKFKRFNKHQTLKHIGREQLGQFFGHFRPDFAASGLTLPGPDLPESQYFQALARLLMAPEGLPDRFNEALFAIDEMATQRGQELLQATSEWAGLQVQFKPESSPEEIALQVWLAAPALLARTHNAQRLRRLTAFEYAGSKFAKEERLPFDPGTLSPNPSPIGWARGTEQGPPCSQASTTHQPSTLQPSPNFAALTTALDGWFGRHQRGQQTTRIEVYHIDEEFWFLVRHGDAFVRTPKVEQQRTEIIHFRPERDDVVVYSPERDEIRINARTKGERDLYLEQFGLHLRGRAGYFSKHETYTLEPLRTEGADALEAGDIEGILKIVLHELEVDLGNGN